MTRPQKETVDYFPHFADATDGDTLTALQGRFGNDGYAFWFKLLERLASTDGHLIDRNDGEKWEVFLGKARVDEETGEKIMALLVKMKAIDLELWGEFRFIWCQKFVDNIADAYRNRRRDVPKRPTLAKLRTALEGIISDAGNPVSNAGNPLTTVEKPHTILYDTILNKKGNRGMGETTREDLYKILEDTKGWPRTTQDNLWKLEDVMKDYPGFDYALEFKKFKEYWNTRKLKRPWLALRNWMEKAKERKKDGKDKGRGLPERHSYTEIEYPDDG